MTSLVALLGYLLLVALVCVVVAGFFTWLMTGAHVRAYADGFRTRFFPSRKMLGAAEERVNDAMATRLEGRAK